MRKNLKIDKLDLRQKFSMTAGLVIFICFAVLIPYQIFDQNSKNIRTLRDNSERFAELLVLSSITYMSNSDSDSVIKICKAFYDNPEAAVIRISDNAGRIIVDLHDKNVKSAEPPVKKKYYKNGIFIGELEFTPAKDRYDRELFITVIKLIGLFIIFFTAAVSVAGIVSSGVIQILNGMHAAIDRVAEGDMNSAIAVKSEDEAGRLAAGFNRMMSKLKERIVQLEENERKLFTLMSNLPGIAYRCLNDKEWTMEFISSGCEELTRYTVDELLYNRDLSYNDLIYAVDRNAVWDSVQAGVSNRRPYRMTYRIRTKSGDEKWVSEQGCGVFSESGGLLALEGFIGDITETKYYELRLLESERRLSTLMSNLPGMAYRCLNDDNWTMEFASGGCKALTGYEPDEIIGNREISYNDLIHPENRTMVKSEIGRSLPEHIPFRIEYRITTKEGNEKWVWEQGRGVYSDTGEVISIEGFITDITGRKKIEDELQEYREHLEREVKKRTQELLAANRELEAFAYSVSHDLRAPLRAVDGFSKALAEDFTEKLNEEGRDYIRRIRGASQKMAQLIDDMLKLSRVTRDEMKYTSVCLSDIAEEIINEHRDSEPERKVEFINTPGLIVNGDQQLIHAALENLLSNAWKFTSLKDVAKIELGTKLIEGETVYFIRDNGAGFEMRYADKLFGAFQRLHAVTEFPGTGIGLAIVQRVLNRHGGRIWAESEVNRGAAFYFTIP